MQTAALAFSAIVAAEEAAATAAAVFAYKIHSSVSHSIYIG
jgi:hypothetical protein